MFGFKKEMLQMVNHLKKFSWTIQHRSSAVTHLSHTCIMAISVLFSCICMAQARSQSEAEPVNITVMKMEGNEDMCVGLSD